MDIAAAFASRVPVPGCGTVHAGGDAALPAAVALVLVICSES
jgi:hypothetical protein